MKFWEKWRRSLLVVLLPIVSYCLLGPLEIYFGNKKDFQFAYMDFFWPFLLLAVSAWIIISLVISVFPEKMNRVLGACILGVGVASYIQNMFMNIKLSETNGAPMNWESLGSYPVINGLIYGAIVIVIVSLSFVAKKYWNIIAMGGGAFLSAVQLVAVVSLLITAPTTDGNESLGLQESGEKQFQVATDSNVIVFVLDTFGTAQVKRILEQYPDALDSFSDFTYYDNADCHYYVTFPSMTHLLTGSEFDFNSTSERWLRESWASQRAVDFYDKLKQEQYECNLYSPEIGYVYGSIENLVGKFDNVKPMEHIVHRWPLMKKIGKMSIYRYVPYFAKPYFEVLTKDFSKVTDIKEGRAVISDNGEFYQCLAEERLSINSNMKNAFIVQHLFGAHAPYTIDAEARTVEESTQLETGRGLLTIVSEYFQQLKDLGVYDNATIIVMADHGAWHGNDTQPVFFIKEKKETHDEMAANSAPVSWDDFQATILSIIGKDYSGYGTSIYDWKEGDERKRTVFMVGQNEEYPPVAGSISNVYYEYNYLTDGVELKRKVEAGPDNVLPATPWTE